MYGSYSTLFGNAVRCEKLHVATHSGQEIWGFFIYLGKCDFIYLLGDQEIWILFLDL